MPMAWFLASKGTMSVWVLALVWGIASYVGTLPFYFLWYWGNRVKINAWLAKYGKWLFIKPSEVDTAFGWFEKRWSGLVFVGRLIPIVRTVISFPAWCVKMRFLPFSALTLAGSILRSGILATAGYYLWENWQSVSWFIGKYEHTVLYVGIACVAAYFFYLFWNRSKK